MTRTGWYLLRQRIFCTRIIRHSLNPIWDEKPLFHVREYESTFEVQLTVLNWDSLSSNDHVRDASFRVEELVEDATRRDVRRLGCIRVGGCCCKTSTIVLSWEKITNRDRRPQVQP
ncbi:hypothetical protein PILCRDRAFT_812387 [Piloderma croceum F 1598]|uniref:C2 domain-containing protein n=1 Tax=Piloderma croceum (strain F 1598) TaxID=765440 RepID=A0A0C3GFX3_PILCF|nr:hypothetical protein PILCRDRAFT_812387 [Piloderma croceum F 1598]